MPPHSTGRGTETIDRAGERGHKPRERGAADGRRGDERREVFSGDDVGFADKKRVESGELRKVARGSRGPWGRHQAFSIVGRMLVLDRRLAPGAGGATKPSGFLETACEREGKQRWSGLGRGDRVGTAEGGCATWQSPVARDGAKQGAARAGFGKLSRAKPAALWTYGASADSNRSV